MSFGFIRDARLTIFIHLAAVVGGIYATEKSRQIFPMNNAIYGVACESARTRGP